MTGSLGRSGGHFEEQLSTASTAQHDRLNWRSGNDSYINGKPWVRGADQELPRSGFVQQLRSPNYKNDWIFRGVEFWKQWRGRSLRLLENARYVVVADIAGFYDNIDLDRLGSDVRGTCTDTVEVRELMSCLRTWAHSRGKGIPQGYSASDILSKLYMKPVDQALRSGGYTHLRYVDDVRVFARTLLEAEKSVEHLSRILFQRGLTVQSAKTRILDRVEASTLIDGVAPVIKEVHASLQRELKTVAHTAGLYLSPQDITDLLGENPAGSPAVLKNAFDKYVLSLPGKDVDSTLLHFLLNRLAIVESRVAVPRCVQLLTERPEEAEHILSYLRRVGVTGGERQGLVRFLSKKLAFRQYTHYLVLRWLCIEGRRLEGVLQHCRELVRDRNSPPWTRAYALAYLADHGNEADFEDLEQRYSSLGDDLERAEYVFAIRRQERSRRNAFYKRVERRGGLVKRVISTAKERD